MKKLIAATLLAFALATPAMAIDLSGIDGIPADMKDMIAKKSGGRITNSQGGGQGEQQAGQDGQQQQGRQARKRQGGGQGMQSIDQLMKGDTSSLGNIGQGLGGLR